MRLLIAGAGAIGGFLAAQFAAAGHDVAVVARGRQLEAIRSDGLRLVTAAGPDIVASVDTYGTLEDAGSSDAIIVTVKAYQLQALAPMLAGAAMHTRMFVPVQNGIGWWYFHGLIGKHAQRRIHAVDPTGQLSAAIPARLIVPMFAFKAAEVIAPGVIRHIPSETDQFPLGELDGAETPRLRDLADALSKAGLKAPIADVRAIMWTKLLGNIYANPICALTQVALGPVVTHPSTRKLALRVMQECASVAEAFGVEIPISFEQRLARSAAIGAARPSMLQDREAGRQMELDAILASLVELGELEGIPTPCVQSLLACLQLVDVPTMH